MVEESKRIPPKYWFLNWILGLKSFSEIINIFRVDCKWPKKPSHWYFLMSTLQSIVQCRFYCRADLNAASMVWGRSQTTLTNFWAFLTSLPPWLTALPNKIYDIYLVTLTFHEPPSPIGVNVVCEWQLHILNNLKF